MLKKQVVGAVVAGLIAAVLLVGCGGPQEGPAPTGGPGGNGPMGNAVTGSMNGPGASSGNAPAK